MEVFYERIRGKNSPLFSMFKHKGMEKMAQSVKQTRLEWLA